MAHINLLPPELARRRRARRINLMLAAGVGSLVVLLLAFYLIHAGRLSSARSRLDEQNAANARLNAQVSELGRFAQMQQELANKRQLLTGLTVNEIRWSVILSDIATVIPANVWLTNFTGTVQLQAPGSRTTGAAGQLVPTARGQIQMSGCTLVPPDGTHIEVAKWLVRLGIPKEFVLPYLSLSAKGTPACPVTFTSMASLTDAALRRNQPGGGREP